MRINHIYITKEGEPMAIPINDDGTWSEGYLRFENKDQEVESFVWDTVGVDAFTAKDGPLRFKPDTFIPAELEVDVVTLVREIGDDEWEPEKVKSNFFKYRRKVIRIKP